MFQENYNKKNGQIEFRIVGRKNRLKSALLRGKLLDEICIMAKNLFLKVFGLVDAQIGMIGRYLLYKNIPIVHNRVVFFTFQGKYTCNSKYIAEKLLELHPEYEVFFVINKEVQDRTELDIPEQVKFVLKDSAEAYHVLSTARVWVDNALCCVWRIVPKRKGQIYINTWHGSLGIKVLGGNKRWRGIAKKADRQIDCFLTNSTFDEEVFSKSFWPNVKHLKVGHPRNDLFFDDTKMNQMKEKVYAHYGIAPHEKTVLYAPTFRNNKEDVSAILLDYQKLKAVLTRKFGGCWKVLVRPHFHNLAAFKFDDKDVINASDYDDMQELIAAMDVGITDYSSWIFDYIFTKRPAFIYARDIDAYINSRGFYYSLSETPFSIASDDEVLSENIKQFDQNEYEIKITRFLEERGCYENGTASEAVVNYIVNGKVYDKTQKG